MAKRPNETIAATDDPPDVGAVRDYMRALQTRIVQGLVDRGERAFRRDEWQRPEGGGGVSM